MLGDLGVQSMRRGASSDISVVTAATRGPSSSNPEALGSCLLTSFEVLPPSDHSRNARLEEWTCHGELVPTGCSVLVSSSTASGERISSAGTYLGRDPGMEK